MNSSTMSNEARTPSKLMGDLRAELQKKPSKPADVLKILKLAIVDNEGIEKITKAIGAKDQVLFRPAILKPICDLADPDKSQRITQHLDALRRLVSATADILPQNDDVRWMLLWLRNHYGDQRVGNVVSNLLNRSLRENGNAKAVAKSLAKTFAETGYNSARWDQLFEAARKATPDEVLSEKIMEVQKLVRDGPPPKPPAVTPITPALAPTPPAEAVAPAEPVKEKPAAKKPVKTPAAEPAPTAAEIGHAIAEAFRSAGVTQPQLADLARRVDSLEQDKSLRAKLNEALAERDGLRAKAAESEKKYRDDIELADLRREALKRDLDAARAEAARLQKLETTAAKRVESAEQRADQNVHEAGRQRDTAVAEFRRRLGAGLGRYLMDIGESDADGPISAESARLYLERLQVIRSTLADHEIRVD